MHTVSVMEYQFVGNIYKGLMIFEGRTVVDDHFLVVDEYQRPGEPSYGPTRYCLLMSISTGVMHEVAVNRLKYGPHYNRVTF